MALRDRIRARRPGTIARRESADVRAPRDERRPAGDEVRDRPAAAARERQRAEFGGINWGAAFFGWIVAVGIGALLTAMVSAAGAAVAISELNGVGDAVQNADTIGVVGGIALFVIALVAYFAGGYVAGRMSRFDGARQGLAVWVWGLIVAIVLAIVGAIAGSEYNVFGALNLPRVPVDEGTVTTGGVIVLIAVVLGTILAAMAGGKAGERYHRKVDVVGEERYAYDR
jgi:uncharacterized membrane protein